MLVVILVALAIVAVLLVVRLVLNDLRPSEIDRFRTASSLTTAWSRGEEWPPAYPDEPTVPAVLAVPNVPAVLAQAQRSSTPRQGLPRSSAT